MNLLFKKNVKEKPPVEVDYKIETDFPIHTKSTNAITTEAPELNFIGPSKFSQDVNAPNISKINQAIRQMTGKVDNLQRAVENAGVIELVDLEQKVDSIETNVETLSGNVTNIVDSVDALETVCDDNTDAINALIAALQNSEFPGVTVTRGYDVFLIGGSENAVGYGPGKKNALDYSNVLILQYGRFASDLEDFPTSLDHKIILAQDPLHHKSNDYSADNAEDHGANENTFGQIMNRIGCAMTFCRKYIDAGFLKSGRKILLVPCAVFGSSFTNGNVLPDYGSWEYPNGINCIDAIERANYAMAAKLCPDGENHFKGFIWIQGENEDGSTQLQHQIYMNTLVNGLRLDITGAETAPFMIGRMCESQWGNQIDLAILSLPNLMDDSIVINSYATTPIEEDDKYFDADSQRLLGGRFFDAYYFLNNSPLIYPNIDFITVTPHQTSLDILLSVPFIHPYLYFVVDYKLSNQSIWLNAYDEQTSFSFSISNLQDDSSYDIRVRCGTNGDYIQTNETTEVIPTTIPQPPTNVVATHGNQKATISFTSPVDNGGRVILSYTVYSLPESTPTTSTSSPIEVDNLENGQEYTFIVVATNVNGDSDPSDTSDPCTPSTVPNPPTNLVASIGNHQCTTTFDAPLDDGGATIDSYTVYSSPGNFHATGTSSPITVTGLTNGTSYVFHILATNLNGNSELSDASNSSIPSTVPNAPTSIVATKGNAQASIAFTLVVGSGNNGGASVTSYTATSSPGGFFTTGSSSPLIVTGLTNGTSYTFQVIATNISGNSVNSLSSNAIVPSTIPNPPTNLIPTFGNQQVSVMLTAPANNGGASIVNYTVTSSPGSFSTTSNTLPIVVTGLTNGQSYTFNAVATNINGNSVDSSDSDPCTPCTIPDPPTDLVLSQEGNEVLIDLTPPIDDGGSDIISYTAITFLEGVEYGDPTTSTSLPISISDLTIGQSFTFKVIATNIAGDSVESVESDAWLVLSGIPTQSPVFRYINQANSSISVYFDPPKGRHFDSYTVVCDPGNISISQNSYATPIVFTNLTNGTDYTFSIFGSNAYGDSPIAYFPTPVQPLDDTLGKAANVRAVADSQSAIVTFDPPASDNGKTILSFNVISIPDSITANGVSVNNTLPGVYNDCRAMLIVEGLMFGVSYTFIVQCVNEDGVGTSSDPSNSISPEEGTPSAPRNLIAKAGNGQATIDFDFPRYTGGEGYEISDYTIISTPGGFSNNSTTSPMTITGLTNGVWYTFQGFSYNLIGTSAASVASNVSVPGRTDGRVTNFNPVAGNQNVTITFDPPSSFLGIDMDHLFFSINNGQIEEDYIYYNDEPSITFSNLTNGVTYSFDVASYALGGSETAIDFLQDSLAFPRTFSLGHYLFSLTPSTIPDTPSNVTAQRTDGGALVSVDGFNGGSAITGYSITYSPGDVQGSYGATLPISIGSLNNSIHYSFTVVAINANGSSASSSASNTLPTPQIPGTPISVSASRINNGAIVSFTKGSDWDVVTTYTVTSSPGGFQATGSSSPLTITTGLTNTTQYSFTVVANNFLGSSSTSSSSNTLSIPTVPGTPTGIVATKISESIIDVSFTPGSNGGIGPVTYTVLVGGSDMVTGTSSPIRISDLTSGSYSLPVYATNPIGNSNLGDMQYSNTIILN
jgi:hypothetical protein